MRSGTVPSGLPGKNKRPCTDAHMAAKNVLFGSVPAKPIEREPIDVLSFVLVRAPALRPTIVRRRIGNGWQLVEVNTSTGNATLMPVTQTGVRAGRYVGLQYATAATPSFRNGTGINPADHAWPPSSQAFRFNDLGGVVTLVLTNAQDLLIAN
jgi:hypothetical protein